MPERATVFEGVQIGVEVTPGTAVAANKKLQGLELIPGMKGEFQEFRPQGYKHNTIVVPTKEWTGLKLNGVPAFNDMLYLLSGLVSVPVTTQIIPSTGLAYRHVFASDSDGPDTIKTYTAEKGSSVRAGKWPYMLFTELGMKWTRKETTLDGSAIGQRYQDNIVLTATPTEIALVPVLPTYVDILVADSAAGLGAASPLNRAFEAEWKLGDRFNPVWRLRSTDESYAAHVETEPSLTGKLMVAADTEGMAFITTMRAGATKFVRIKCQGALIETGNYYLLQVDTAFKCTEPEEFKDHEGVYAYGVNFTAAHDATWGKAYEITLQNTLATL